METIIQLTPEKFEEIYTNEQFRNQVAFAHVHTDSNNNFKYRATCSYPVKYIVTDGQIEKANKEYERMKKIVFETHKNDLLFVGMGMTYNERYPDDICNHRIRTEFLNREGKRYFVEFGTGQGNQIHCDHSIDCDLLDLKEEEITKVREKMKGCTGFVSMELRKQMDESQKQSYNNYKGLERKRFSEVYSKTNILNIVNETFNCNFKVIIIDNYNIHCDDKQIICISPK
jgi:hypothetical protein